MFSLTISLSAARQRARDISKAACKWVSPEYVHPSKIVESRSIESILFSISSKSPSPINRRFFSSSLLKS